MASAVHVYWNAGAWDEALHAVEWVEKSPEIAASPVGIVSSIYRAAISAARGVDTDLPDVDLTPSGHHGLPQTQARPYPLRAEPPVAHGLPLILTSTAETSANSPSVGFHMT